MSLYWYKVTAMPVTGALTPITDAAHGYVISTSLFCHINWFLCDTYAYFTTHLWHLRILYHTCLTLTRTLPYTFDTYAYFTTHLWHVRILYHTSLTLTHTLPHTHITAPHAYHAHVALFKALWALGSHDNQRQETRCWGRYDFCPPRP